MSLVSWNHFWPWPKTPSSVVTFSNALCNPGTTVNLKWVLTIYYARWIWHAVFQNALNARVYYLMLRAAGLALNGQSGPFEKKLALTFFPWEKIQFSLLGVFCDASIFSVKMKLCNSNPHNLDRWGDSWTINKRFLYLNIVHSSQKPFLWIIILMQDEINVKRTFLEPILHYIDGLLYVRTSTVHPITAWNVLKMLRKLAIGYIVEEKHVTLYQF